MPSRSVSSVNRQPGCRFRFVSRFASPRWDERACGCLVRQAPDDVRLREEMPTKSALDSTTTLDRFRKRLTRAAVWPTAVVTRDKTNGLGQFRAFFRRRHHLRPVAVLCPVSCHPAAGGAVPWSNAGRPTAPSAILERRRRAGRSTRKQTIRPCGPQRTDGYETCPVSDEHRTHDARRTHERERTTQGAGY